MKLTIVLCFFITICAAQKREAIITFVDSTTFDGYAELTSLNRIKFRPNLEDKPDKLGPKEILQVEFIGSLNNTIYRYVRYKSKGIYMLLKVIEDGTLSLYVKERKRIKNNLGLPNKHFDESLNIPISRRSNEYEKYVEAYYLHDKDKSTLYRYINDKTLLETFNDCQILKEAVESGEFSDRSLEDWVWEYNYECGKN
jgi:hypothetical protein